jgi:superoxide dismutase
MTTFVKNKTMKKILSIGAMLISFISLSQPFELPKLTYEYAALEPYIDAQTMEIHYSKHHNAYVTNLNKAIVGTKLETLTLDQLLLNAGKRSDAIRNNAGGHYNHSLFWKILAAKPTTKPNQQLMNAIIESFGGLDSLKKAMTAAASTRFGSGWAWLIVTPDKKLKVTSTANQDNPIMDVAQDRGIPIIGIDVWEHAYYLKYQNKRGDYLGAFWSVLDWNAVYENYTAALNDPLLKLIEKDAWKELKDFHKVMSQTFHPAEENNLTPIRERSQEMLEKALALQNGKIPASFDTPEIKKAISNLVTGAEELHKLNKKKTKDAVLKEKLTSLHDAFHVIQGLCIH